MAQNVRPPDLVVEQIEPVTRLGFRLVVEFPLQSPDRIGCLQAHRHSPPPHRRQKRTRSPGPSLHRRYPASAVLRPCPTPARTAACAALRPLPSSPERAELPKVPLSVAQWNGGGGFPRLHNPCLDVLCPFPGGLSRCVCRLLPGPCGLPRTLGGSASTTSLSGPAQASLTLRPVESLSRPRRPLSQGFDTASCPTAPPASYRANRPLPGWDFHPQGDCTLRGAPELHGVFRGQASDRLIGNVGQFQALRAQRNTIFLRDTPCEPRVTPCPLDWRR